MSEPGFASLGPTLLARKGGAKPAMRPQVAPLVADEAAIAAIADEQLEDLGWNDMGQDAGSDGHNDNGADVVPINQAVAAAEADAAHNPIVRRQQRRLEERVLADAVMTGPEDEAEESCADEDDAYLAHEDHAEAFAAGQDFAPEPVALPAAPARVAVRKTERRAAFTLRLDPERHLKLRLAATMQGMSAQNLVTEALDRLLAEIDDLDIIAAHLKRH
ncbi:MAG: toxin-antitoxin system HicB family antitoxin [Erythrobacter sp.]|jgi:hypothetical protein|nr:toxin-antitoxin system HicB family antitoxin [Erythrobacter sp.]